jgi:outer membrane lipoprotein carrier protein
MEFFVIRFSRQILISLSLLCAAPAFAEEAIAISVQPVINTQDAIKDLQYLLGKVKSFSSRFVQEAHNGQGEVLQSMKGRMDVAKPGKLRWETEGVYEQLVISDGKSLWVYDQDLEQVSIKDMDNRLAETPALLLGGDISAIETDFIVSQQYSDSQMVFLLQPKDTTQLFDSLEISFNKHSEQQELQQMIIRDASGQVTEIRFSDATNNPKLSDDIFTFAIPKGVDVIDGRQGAY